MEKRTGYEKGDVENLRVKSRYWSLRNETGEVKGQEFEERDTGETKGQEIEEGEGEVQGQEIEDRNV